MRILLLTAMILFATSASAGLYKWVDSDGNVHYSQKPPRDTQYKRLKAPPPAPEDAKSPYQTPVAPKEKPDGTVKKLTDKNLKIRAENCEKAKKNLTNFQIHRRIKDKDGNVTVIDDKDRQKEIENAQKAIRDFCN